MLKKVMIICIAFSFVFIGGIAFAAGKQPDPPKEGQTMIPESAPISGDVVPDVPAEPTDLTTDESKTIIEEGVEVKEEGVELKDKVIELKDKVIE
jgi:hypothetical protein